MSYSPGLEGRIKRYEQILQGTHIGTWEWNVQTGETILNERWAEIIGFKLKDFGNTTINTWLNFVHPQDSAASDRALEAHFKGETEFYECEARMRHKNGHWVWVLDRGKVVSWTKDGKPEWMAGSHQDITERKNREEMLVRYSDLLDKSNEAAKIGTWELDLETLLVHWSRVSREIYEVEGEHDIPLKSNIDFFRQGGNRQAIIRLLNEAIEFGRPFDKELEIISQLGNKRWVRAIGIPEMSGAECKRVYGLFQDITEKNLMHQELVLQEQQFRNTFDNAPNGIALVGLDGRWLRVNKSLCDMLGYSPDELMALRFEDITFSEDIGPDWQLVHELLEGKRENYQIEKRYIHKNGYFVWALLAVSLIRSEKGEPLHFVSQINDISIQKNSQLEIQQLLDTTREQNARLLNFAHIVSHNLRSHVGNFSMLLELFSTEAPECTNNDFFPLLQHSADSLHETIGYLNDVVAVNEPSEEDMKEINLLDFVRKALLDLSTQISKDKAQVNVKIPENTMVLGIPAYVDSILLNFISNAIKYSSKDRKLKIDLHLDEPVGDYHVLRIRDNGLGIDLNAHGKKLFGMFKTFHGNSDAKGVGLFLSKSQIEAMGGKVDVESEVDKGTIFKIYLRNAGD
ncbi:MAG: PAS domain S-box protein [Bacteroidetes bacterium]|nr:PAS domain S-box protein [Bacteroidota bacterium]